MSDGAELLDRAAALAAAGRGSEAIQAYDRAAAASEASGDIGTWVGALLGLARGQQYNAVPGELPARLHTAYLRVVDEADRARVAAALARCWAYSGHATRGMPFASVALDLARNRNDPVLLVDCLDAALATHWGPDELTQRTHWVTELDEAAAHLTDPQARLQANLWQLTVGCETLDLLRMNRAIRAIELLGDEDPTAAFFAASRRLMLDLLRARTDTAEYLRGLARDAAQRVLIADADGVLHAMTCYPAVLTGDRRVALEEAEIHEAFGVREGAWAVLAEAVFLYAEAGDLERAESVLGYFAGDLLATLPRDADWLLTLQCVLEGALAVGHRALVAAAAELLTPYEGRAVVNAGAVMFHGVTDDTLARANTVLGNEQAAERLAGQALGTYRRIGASWWAARLSGRRSPHSPNGPTWHLHPCAAGVWSVGADPTPALVPQMKGLSYLHRLLERPGQHIDVVDLVRSLTGEVATQGGLGEVVDSGARTAYRHRLESIGSALAEQQLDPRRRAELTAEAAALRAQLRSATGAGGRARVEGATSERARVAVRKAIIAALARVAEHDAELARHLLAHTHTGAVCRYEPPAQSSVEWVL